MRERWTQSATRSSDSQKAIASASQQMDAGLDTGPMLLREAVPIIRHFVEVFRDAETIVIPSSSCVSMMRDHYLKAAEMVGDAKLAADVAALLPRARPMRTG